MKRHRNIAPTMSPITEKNLKLFVREQSGNDNNGKVVYTTMKFVDDSGSNFTENTWLKSRFLNVLKNFYWSSRKKLFFCSSKVGDKLVSTGNPIINKCSDFQTALGIKMPISLMTAINWISIRSQPTLQTCTFMVQTQTNEPAKVNRESQIWLFADFLAELGQ